MLIRLMLARLWTFYRVEQEASPVERMQQDEDVVSVDSSATDDQDPEEQVVVRYPFVGVGAISLQKRDLDRLGSSELLNDNLIMFGLRLLHDHFKDKNPSLGKGIHIFDSQFFTTLKEGWSLERTSSKHIFDKTFLVFPINENEHWYLVIIEQSELTRPVAMVLDSVEASPDRHRKTITLLQMYLTQEASQQSSPAPTYSHMRSIFAKAPRQTNDTDCGIYLLHYFQCFFENHHRAGILARSASDAGWKSHRLSSRRKGWRLVMDKVTEDYQKRQKVDSAVSSEFRSG